MPKTSPRAIPSVDKLLLELGETTIPRPAVLALVRRELAEARASGGVVYADSLMADLKKALGDLRAARIQPVINGTGILIHTNLGRAPLGPKVIARLSSIGSHYNNLEYDLTGGRRGGRAAYLEHNLAVLCGAPAATAVNNCAAALLLILRRFTNAQKPQVIISRGELIQIGGGFRIPDILEASGATLREVGTTNKTTLDDYRRAIGKQTAMILKVHRSNFYMGGFVESPDTAAIARLARQKKIPFVEDLGSGATFRTDSIPGMEHEPTPAEALKAGVDLVCFSGDKLLGGPQAGIIAGKQRFIASLKREPFFRAFRCDKLILAALEATVDLHLIAAAGDVNSAPSGIPVIDLLHLSNDSLAARAAALLRQLSGLALSATIGAGKSQIGGGTLPRSSISSITLDLVPHRSTLEEFAAALRANDPPIIGYISAARFKLDLRTIFPEQDQQIARAVQLICGC